MTQQSQQLLSYWLRHWYWLDKQDAKALAGVDDLTRCRHELMAQGYEIDKSTREGVESVRYRLNERHVVTPVRA